MYQIEVLYPQRVQGVGNDFDFQFGDTARYRDVDGCGVGERLVRPYRDFMRGVDVLVGPVERRGRNGGGGQRADLFLVEDTRSNGLSVRSIFTEAICLVAVMMSRFRL